MKLLLISGDADKRNERHFVQCWMRSIQIEILGSLSKSIQSLCGNEGFIIKYFICKHEVYYSREFR